MGEEIRAMKYIVEYSRSQDAYHLSDESEWAGNVLYTIGVEVDYEIIGEFDTYQEASDFIAKKRGYEIT